MAGPRRQIEPKLTYSERGMLDIIAKSMAMSTSSYIRFILRNHLEGFHTTSEEVYGFAQAYEFFSHD